MNVNAKDIFRYYIVWDDYEKELIEGIAERNTEKFKKYLVEMKVIRNIKQGKSSAVLEIAKKFIDENPVNLTNADGLSERLKESGVLQDRISNAIVLASKVLWVLNKEKVIIMDSHAKESLEKLSNKKIKSYKDFCTIWEDFYRTFKTKFKEEAINLNVEKVSPIFEEEWFIRRSFDNYLWIGEIEN